MPKPCEEKTYDSNPKGSFREGDYEFARTHSRRKSGRRLERGYDVARHFAGVIKARRRDESAVNLNGPTVEQEFREHARQWWQETRILSSIQSKAFNQHYQRIIGMGRAVLPLIFTELRDRGGYWYWALECITGDNPASTATTVREAKAVWLAYGAQHGYLRC